MSTLLSPLAVGAGLDGASPDSAGAADSVGAADSAGVSGVESGDSAGEGAAASPPLWQPGIKRSSVAASTRDRNFFIGWFLLLGAAARVRPPRRLERMAIWVRILGFIIKSPALLVQYLYLICLHSFSL